MSADDTQLGTTDADRERIANILRTRGEVSPETCAAIRRLVHDGRTPAGIAEDDDTGIHRSESAIRHHAFGRCKHDVDEQSRDVPRETQHPPITRDECARIRRRRTAGTPASDIADEMECGESTVYAHANGRCSHEIEAAGEAEA